MTVLLATVVGFLAGRLVWLLVRPVFSTAIFSRQNYRGRRIATGAGLVLGISALAVEAARVLLAAPTGGRGLDPARAGLVVLVVGLCLVGLVDDLAGDAEDRGFRGHLRALPEGRLTTGALKLFGGGAVAVLAVSLARPDEGFGFLLVDAALVALAANLGNLFDRAPGRTIKLSGLAFVVLVVATMADRRLAGAAVIVGAALALLLEDLHERVMLGDTGANLLGGALGLAVVATASPGARLAVLGVVAILNGVSEWVSFSRVIDAVAPLRALDRAGRRTT
ncbi:MAG: hypothetical protein KY454_05575 [Actinobacteria bacterium]|nr:hypothetical protein [Actinomycetota bacterium]MBW3649677.1 hypothetical protein [Actinomycetota bacterium]